MPPKSDFGDFIPHRKIRKIPYCEKHNKFPGTRPQSLIALAGRVLIYAKKSNLLAINYAFTPKGLITPKSMPLLRKGLIMPNCIDYQVIIQLQYKDLNHKKTMYNKPLIDKNKEN